MACDKERAENQPAFGRSHASPERGVVAVRLRPGDRSYWTFTTVRSITVANVFG